MFAISICRKCGRTMDNAFFYCPWCGQSRSLGSDKTAREINYERVQEQQKSLQQEKIRKMQNRLDELENELSVLVLSTEMHK